MAEVTILSLLNDFDKDHPGFLDFVEKLQVGTKIKFKGLKFGNPETGYNPKDVTIQIVYREEIGDKPMRCPGVGCIEYANIKENGEFADCHKDGWFPCQTFMSMRGWFRASDSYEIL
ncbi:hypothetical protein KY334_08215 [Candidatus Woesearchaeota archaeon]|nr:hypothetical protein [Candidatus Woesearchaeota archaeon]